MIAFGTCIFLLVFVCALAGTRSPVRWLLLHTFYVAIDVVAAAMTSAPLLFVVVALRSALVAAARLYNATWTPARDLPVYCRSAKGIERARGLCSL